VTRNEQPAASGRDDAGDGPHGGRLAGPIGTQQPQYLPRLHIKVQRLDSNRANGYALQKIGDLDQMALLHESSVIQGLALTWFAHLAILRPLVRDQ